MSKTQVIMKHACPFCLKFAIFAAEGGFADRIDFVTVEDGSADIDQWREKMRDVGIKPSFPAAIMDNGAIMVESDALIAHFGEKFGVTTDGMYVYNEYLTGLFVRVGKMFRELTDLKAARDSAAA